MSSARLSLRVRSKPARLIRVRNGIVALTFVVVFGVGFLIRADSDALQPGLFALGIAMCAKVIVEYLFGLPMRLARVVAWPRDRPRRVRILLSALMVMAWMIYLLLRR